MAGHCRVINKLPVIGFVGATLSVFSQLCCLDNDVNVEQVSCLWAPSRDSPSSI